MSWVIDIVPLFFTLLTNGPLLPNPELEFALKSGHKFNTPTHIHPPDFDLTQESSDLKTKLCIKWLSFN